MSDDDKLAAPSFEPMDAGVTFGDSGYAFSSPTARPRPSSYTRHHRSAPTALPVARARALAADGPAGVPAGLVRRRRAARRCGGRSSARFAAIEERRPRRELRSRAGRLDDPLVGQAPLPSRARGRGLAPQARGSRRQARVQGGGMVLVPQLETLGVADGRRRTADLVFLPWVRRGAAAALRPAGHAGRRQQPGVGRRRRSTLDDQQRRGRRAGAGAPHGTRPRHRPRPAPGRAHRPGAGLADLRAELLPADRVRRARRCRGCSRRPRADRAGAAAAVARASSSCACRPA